MTHKLQCGRCPATAPLKVAFKQQHLPDGWTSLQLTGTPIIGMALCPVDSEKVRRFLALKE